MNQTAYNHQRSRHGPTDITPGSYSTTSLVHIPERTYAIPKVLDVCAHSLLQIRLQPLSFTSLPIRYSQIILAFAGSIPAGVLVRFFIDSMLPAALLALRSTQPLIEMSTRKFPWGYVGLTLPLSCAYSLEYPDSLIPLEAQGPILASTGKALPYPTFASTHSELTTASQHIQNKYVTAYRQGLEVSPASHSDSLNPFCAAITMPTPPCNVLSSSCNSKYSQLPSTACAQYLRT